MLLSRLQCQGGAKGVGVATTKAVVISYVAIIILDFLATYVQFKTVGIGLFDS